MQLDLLRIPDDVWSHGEVQDALRARAVGRLFRLLARLTGASQTRIGAAVGLDQGYVSRVAAGRKVTSIDLLERIADGLDMPDPARMCMGLAPRHWSAAPEPASRDSSPAARSWRETVAAAALLWEGDVDRRYVLRQLAFSSAGYTLPALRWFTAVPDPVAQQGPRVVGHPDVDTIQEMTDTYRRLDNQFGGGHSQSAVTRYLANEAQPLLTEGRFDPVIGRRLLSAVAELSQLAGWQAYDMAAHGAAQRHLTTALDLARAAENQALGAEILAAMSHQATYLGHASAGVDLARAAAETARRAGLTGPAAAALVMEAHGHAVARDQRACARTLHHAEQAFDRANRDDNPRWLGYFDEAYLSAMIGRCLHALGDQTRARQFTARSLRMDERYVRGKTFNLALLASIHTRRNEPDRAAALGSQALSLASNLRSARAADYLRGLRHQLTPHRRRPDVRQFVRRVDAMTLPGRA